MVMAVVEAKWPCALHVMSLSTIVSWEKLEHLLSLCLNDLGDFLFGSCSCHNNMYSNHQECIPIKLSTRFVRLTLTVFYKKCAMSPIYRQAPNELRATIEDMMVGLQCSTRTLAMSPPDHPPTSSRLGTYIRGMRDISRSSLSFTFLRINH